MSSKQYDLIKSTDTLEKSTDTLEKNNKINESLLGKRLSLSSRQSLLSSLKQSYSRKKLKIDLEKLLSNTEKPLQDTVELLSNTEKPLQDTGESLSNTEKPLQDTVELLLTKKDLLKRLKKHKEFTSQIFNNKTKRDNFIKIFEKEFKEEKFMAIFSELFTNNFEISRDVLSEAFKDSNFKDDDSKNNDDPEDTNSIKYSYDKRIFAQNLVITLLNDDSCNEKVSNENIDNSSIFRFFLLKQYKELKDKAEKADEVEKKRLKNAEILIKKYLGIDKTKEINAKEIQTKILKNKKNEDKIKELLDLAYLGLADLTDIPTDIDNDILINHLKNFIPFPKESTYRNVFLNKNLANFIAEYCKKDIKNRWELIEIFFIMKENTYQKGHAIDNSIIGKEFCENKKYMLDQLGVIDETENKIKQKIDCLKELCEYEQAINNAYQKGEKLGNIKKEIDIIKNQVIENKENKHLMLADYSIDGRVFDSEIFFTKRKTTENHEKFDKLIFNKTNENSTDTKKTTKEPISEIIKKLTEENEKNEENEESCDLISKSGIKFLKEFLEKEDYKDKFITFKKKSEGKNAGFSFEIFDKESDEKGKVFYFKVEGITCNSEKDAQEKFKSIEIAYKILGDNAVELNTCKDKELEFHENDNKVYIPIITTQAEKGEKSNEPKEEFKDLCKIFIISCLIGSTDVKNENIVNGKLIDFEAYNCNEVELNPIFNEKGITYICDYSLNDDNLYKNVLYNYCFLMQACSVHAGQSCKKDKTMQMFEDLVNKIDNRQEINNILIDVIKESIFKSIDVCYEYNDKKKMKLIKQNFINLFTNICQHHSSIGSEIFQQIQEKVNQESNYNKKNIYKDLINNMEKEKTYYEELTNKVNLPTQKTRKTDNETSYKEPTNKGDLPTQRTRKTDDEKQRKKASKLEESISNNESFERILQNKILKKKFFKTLKNTNFEYLQNSKKFFKTLISNENACKEILKDEELRKKILDSYVPQTTYSSDVLRYLMNIFDYNNKTRLEILTHKNFNEKNDYKYNCHEYSFTKNVLLNFLNNANNEDLQKLADNLDNNLVVRYALIKEYKHLQSEGKNTDNIETIFKFYLESERKDKTTDFVFNKLLKSESSNKDEKIDLNDKNIDSILDLIQSGAINYSDLNTDNLSHELLELIYNRINDKIFCDNYIYVNNCFLNKNISNFVFDFVSDDKIADKINKKINTGSTLKQDFIDRLIFLKDVVKSPSSATSFDSIIINQIIEAQDNFLKRYEELAKSNKEYSNSLLDEEKYQFFKDIVNVGKITNNYSDYNKDDFDRAKLFISRTIDGLKKNTNNKNTNDKNINNEEYGHFAILNQSSFYRLCNEEKIRKDIPIIKYKNNDQFEKSEEYSDIFNAQKNKGGHFKSLEEAFSIIKDIDKDNVKQLKEFLMEDHHLFDGLENQTVEFIKKTNGASIGLIIKFGDGPRFFVKNEGNERDVGNSCYLLNNKENSIIPETYIKKYNNKIMTITKGVGLQDLDEALFKAVNDDETIEVENHFMKKLKDKNNKEYLNNFSETFCEIFVKGFITNTLDINANNIRVCDDGKLFLIDCLHYDNVEFNSLLDCDIDGNNFAENLFVNVFFKSQMLHNHANRTPLNDGTKKIFDTLINNIGQEKFKKILIQKIGQSIIDVKTRYNNYINDAPVNEEKRKDMEEIYLNSIFKFKRLLSDICVHYPDIAENIIRTIETKDKELFSEIKRDNKNIQKLANNIGNKNSGTKTKKNITFGKIVKLITDLKEKIKNTKKTIERKEFIEEIKKFLKYIYKNKDQFTEIKKKNK